MNYRWKYDKKIIIEGAMLVKLLFQKLSNKVLLDQVW